MSDQKITEFRERAELGVRQVDPDLLLERGRALRRRRQLAPLAALAALAAVGYGVYASIPARHQTPAGQVMIPEPEVKMLSEQPRRRVLEPGTYPLEFTVSDGVPDAYVELVGEGWRASSSGALQSTPDAVVSWSLAGYRDVNVNRCATTGAALPGGLSRAQVAEQIAAVPGTRVLEAPAPATFFGLGGPTTHLQISLPMVIQCETGPVSDGALDSMYDGPRDPRVTIDVWVIEHDDEVLLASMARRGAPPPEMLQELASTVESLRFTTVP